MVVVAIAGLSAWYGAWMGRARFPCCWSADALFSLSGAFDGADAAFAGMGLASSATRGKLVAWIVAHMLPVGKADA